MDCRKTLFPFKERWALSPVELKNSPNATIREFQDDGWFIQKELTHQQGKTLRNDVMRNFILINGTQRPDPPTGTTLKNYNVNNVLKAAFSEQEVDLIIAGYNQSFHQLLCNSLQSAFSTKERTPPPRIIKNDEANIYKGQDGNIYLEGRTKSILITPYNENWESGNIDIPIPGSVGVIYVFDKSTGFFKLLNILPSNTYIQHLLFSDKTSPTPSQNEIDFAVAQENLQNVINNSTILPICQKAEIVLKEVATQFQHLPLEILTIVLQKTKELIEPHADYTSTLKEYNNLIYTLQKISYGKILASAMYSLLAVGFFTLTILTAVGIIPPIIDTQLAKYAILGVSSAIGTALIGKASFTLYNDYKEKHSPEILHKKALGKTMHKLQKAMNSGNHLTPINNLVSEINAIKEDDRANIENMSRSTQSQISVASTTQSDEKNNSHEDSSQSTSSLRGLLSSIESFMQATPEPEDDEDSIIGADLTTGDDDSDESRQKISYRA
jgi:hypothetical protein